MEVFLPGCNENELRPFLHGGGGPQVGEVTRRGNPPVHIISYFILITFT